MPEINLNVKFIEGRVFPDKYRYEIFEVGATPEKPLHWKGTIHWPDLGTTYFESSQSVDHLRLTMMTIGQQGPL